MEADLAWRGIDLRDLWRPGRQLTLRRLAVLVRHLPVDSHTAQALGGHGWSITDVLLSDVFHALAGKRHPSRPRPRSAAAVPKRRQAAAIDARLTAQHQRRAAELAAMATT